MKQVSITKNAFISAFSHYCLIFLFGVITMMSSSCQKDKDHIKKTVPLNAEFQTVSTMLQQGPPELDSINGQGNGTPIGKSSFIANAQFDENGNLTGKIVATSDNGDKFFANIVGHAPVIDSKGNITLHFDATISGGTGKFAGATGNFSGIAHENMTTPDGSATWEGTITY